MSPREVRRAENQAAWAAGRHLRRWSSGTHPSSASPRRTGPPSYETGAAERKAAKDARSEANRKAWAARAEAAKVARGEAREAARLARRGEDRRRAAAWHQGRRDDLAVMLAADRAAMGA